MCRAVWVIIYAPEGESVTRLRRAAGLEVQVVGVARTSDELTALIATTRADVLVVDGRAPHASTIATASLSRERGVVWVGDDAPQGVEMIGADALADSLPGAITRALIARTKR